MTPEHPAQVAAALVGARPPAAVDDWPAVARAALDHGLGPLLFWRVDELGLEPPAPVAAELRAAFARAAAENMRLFDALGRLLPALEAAGVEAIVLKGADLAARVYPSLGARPMVDLDLLVRAEDVDRALAALEGVGYRDAGELVLAEGHLERWRKHRVLAGATPALPTLELHWHLLERNWSLRERLDLGWFWRRTEVVEVAGVRTRRLAPEALLLALALHADSHGASRRLLWLADIDRLLRATPALDWPALAAEVERAGCQRAVGEVLARTAEAFGTPLPDEARAWRRAERPAAERSLVALLGQGALPPNVVDLVNSLTIPDRRARLAFLRHQLLPSPAYMRARYGVRHAAALPAYYALRWARGAAGLLATGRSWLRG